MTRGPKPKKPKAAAPDGGSLWEGFSPPGGLSDEARSEFDRLTRVLASVGTLDRTDPRIVLAAARTHGLIERATDELSGDDLTLTAANGTSMPHPMLNVLNTLTMRLRGLWADMGLTPATAKLGDAKGKDDENPWAGLLSVTG